MDISRYLGVFEDFPVFMFDRDQYRRQHGIHIHDDTNLTYYNSVTVTDYSFSSVIKMEEWCVFVVNIKFIANYIPPMARDGESMGGSYEDLVEMLFRRWLKVVNRFIKRQGAEKVPSDIQGAMKDTESNLGLPITFPDAVYMGR